MTIRAYLTAGASLALASALFIACSKDTPVAGSSPSPTPPLASPSPTPAPATDPRITASCRKLGPGTQKHECVGDIPTYLTEVNDAVTKLMGQRPDIFDGVQVLSVGAFYVGVIKNLDAEGICAYFDGDELAVKKEDWFNDQYDVLTGKNTVRSGPSIYAATCYPAWFPPPSDGQFVPGIAPACNLAGSACIACGGDAVHHYQNDFEATLDWAIETHPSIFNFKMTNPGTGDPYVEKGDELVQRVQEHLQSMGYCTRWDGEELGLKKGTNEFAEYFDFFYAAGYLRRGGYASTCYPSCF